MIDLNADLGESFGRYELGNDRDILRYVTSANIACGFHAGDPATMRRTVRYALEQNVAIGAHPGLPDLQGFGRRSMAISEEEAYEMVLYQIGALEAFLRAEGATLQHVKPHGALYTMAARDRGIADGIARAVAAFNPALRLVAPPASTLAAAGAERNLTVLREAFADRRYMPDGSLASRGIAGSLITDPDECARQALSIVAGHVVVTDGTTIPVEAETICIHGDTGGAVAIARRVREALERG